MLNLEKEREQYVKSLTARLLELGVISERGQDLDFDIVQRIEEADNELFLEKNPDFPSAEYPRTDAFGLLNFLSEQEPLPADPEAFVRAYIELRDEYSLDEYIAENADSDAVEYHEYTNRGYSRMHLGRMEEALEDFEKAVELNPNKAGPFGARADVLIKMGQLQQGVEDLERALMACSMGGELPDRYLIKISETLFELGRHQDASLHLTQAAKMLDEMVKCPTDKKGDFHLPTRHQVNDAFALDLYISVRNLKDKLADESVDLKVVDEVLPRVKGILIGKEIL